MIQVKELWQFWEEHKKELASKYICVAEFPDEAIDIYITNDYGYPSLSVFEYDIKTKEAICIDKEDLQQTYIELLDKLFDDGSRLSEEQDEDDVESAGADLTEQSGRDSEDEFDELWTCEHQNRIDEIVDAVTTVLEILLEAPLADNAIDDGELYEIIFDFEDMLCKRGMLVRHPTVVTNDKTGEKKVVDYPYE